MRPAKAGYSLFEVLIAFAVMTLVLGILLPRQTQIVAKAQILEDRLRATDMAQSQLALLGIAVPLEIGTTDRQDGDWRVTQTVETTALPGFSGQVVTVRVRVTNARGQALADLQEKRVLQ